LLKHHKTKPVSANPPRRNGMRGEIFRLFLHAESSSQISNLSRNALIARVEDHGIGQIWVSPAMARAVLGDQDSFHLKQARADAAESWVGFPR